MSITKTNKHKLSLDLNKPNEEGWCTLATPYALMESLILQLANPNHSIKRELPLALQWVYGTILNGKRVPMAKMEGV